MVGRWLSFGEWPLFRYYVRFRECNHLKKGSPTELPGIMGDQADFRHCVRNCFRQLLWPSEGSGLGPGIIELQISMVMWPGWHWFLLLQLVGWEYYLTLVGRCCLFYLEKCHLFKMSSVATWWLFRMSSFDLYELVSRCRKIVDTWNVLKLFRVHIPRPNICPSWGFFNLFKNKES